MGRPSLGLRRQLNVRLPEELIEKIDSARGFTSQSAWIEAAVRLALKPTVLALNPELQNSVHHHTWAPLRTVMTAGVRVRYVKCECGMEKIG